METNISGIREDLLNVLEATLEINQLPKEGKRNLYTYGYSMCDLPYFCRDKDTIENEREIKKKVFEAYDNFVKVLREVTGTKK